LKDVQQKPILIVYTRDVMEPVKIRIRWMRMRICLPIKIC